MTDMIPTNDNSNSYSTEDTANKFLQQIVNIYNMQDDFLYTQQLVQKFNTSEYELCVLLAYVSNKIENDSRYHKYHSTFIALCKLIFQETSIPEILNQLYHEATKQSNISQWNTLLENTSTAQSTSDSSSDESNFLVLNE